MPTAAVYLSVHGLISLVANTRLGIAPLTPFQNSEEIQWISNELRARTDDNGNARSFSTTTATSTSTTRHVTLLKALRSISCPRFFN